MKLHCVLRETHGDEAPPPEPEEDKNSIGDCYGMVSTAGLFYTGKLSLADVQQGVI